jgi:hypothetical protein
VEVAVIARLTKFLQNHLKERAVLEFFLIDNFHFEFIPEGAVVSMV